MIPDNDDAPPIALCPCGYDETHTGGVCGRCPLGMMILTLREGGGDCSPPDSACPVDPDVGVLTNGPVRCTGGMLVNNRVVPCGRDHYRTDNLPIICDKCGKAV